MRTLLLIALLVLPALFAAAEVALLRLRPSQVQELTEEGRPGAQSVQRLQRRLRIALLMTQFGACLSPLLNLLEALAGLLMRLLGLAPQWDVLVPALSAGELETLVESGRVTGLFPDEKNILEGVFALRDTQVREVMVPRSGTVSYTHLTLPTTPYV